MNTLKIALQIIAALLASAYFFIKLTAEVGISGSHNASDGLSYLYVYISVIVPVAHGPLALLPSVDVVRLLF
jgi:hypothetical protein